MRCLSTLLVAFAIVACRGPDYPVVPGDTALGVSAVKLVPREGETLAVDYKTLLGNLGLRAKTLLLPQRGWNPYRLAEDRRRVEAYLVEHGRYESSVDEPRLAWNAAHTSVAVTWPVHEGPDYAIGAVDLRG
ncbi:MAG: hypothetical protein ABI678_31710, partial [Kofleriaceae bacterium]